MAITFLAGVFDPVASAAFGVTIPQVSSADSVRGAAITNTVPKDFRRMMPALGYHDQSAEPLALQINHFHMLRIASFAFRGKPEDPVTVTETHLEEFKP
ncbi:hypothetical protein [Sphingopyxis sp.]|uniref:hypothetical protein n=1 Tax=Sphingopyxis sp. TaxID=1908224 RepID=UPI0025DE5F2E|nr:hypothetical protein [Sphingopyxis sp.]MBK6414116.1 hypothetical protein [Sphingopyxis sp.]